MTFTGDECIYSGPDTFPSGEVTFTLRNESPVQAFLAIVEVASGSTLEEVVAGLPVIEDPTMLPPKPAAVRAFIQLGQGVEAPLGVNFRRAGQFGTACVPFNGERAVRGAPFRIEP